MISPKDFEGRRFEEACRAFRWQIPTPYNIAVEVCDRWALREPNRLAIVHESANGLQTSCTYGALREASTRLANALSALGVGRDDRVAVILHQRVETTVAHLAIYRLGGIVVPLTRMFGPDALSYRLRDSGAKVAVADPIVVPRLVEIEPQIPELKTVIVVGPRPAWADAQAGKTDAARYMSWDEAIELGRSTLPMLQTGPDDSALIIYTSGTTGSPKGALHGHRVLLGHLLSFQLYFDFVRQDQAVYWTPADWAWIGGAFDLMFPALFVGGPVIAFETTRFDPEHAFHLMAKHRVTHTFLPPTALKMLMQIERPRSHYDLALQTVMSGGEPVNPIILEWRDREMPGVQVHEIYGQTEANLVCGNSSRLYPVRPGSLGRAFPGHEVVLLGEDGTRVKPGELGEIAVRGPGDPVVFKEYWHNPDATAAKYMGEWLLTGDMARVDDDGYFYFEGRKDDVINSGGYRIGPAEVESSLLTHPAVAEAAAVGVPDAIRGHIVKAFVKLARGQSPSAALAQEIQDHVKARLAAYAYPRAIEFVDSLPMTATGKIRRSELRARNALRTSTAGTRGS